MTISFASQLVHCHHVESGDRKETASTPRNNHAGRVLE